MHSKTSLDEKLSDLVGNANLKLGNNFNLNYEFSLDQNYKEFNFNEISTSMNFGPSKIDFGFLQEKKHIGNQEFSLLSLIMKTEKMVFFHSRLNEILLLIRLNFII